MNRFGFILSLGLTFLFILAVSVLADVYTWKDANGKINVTQTPPPEGATIIRIIKKATPTPVKEEMTEADLIRDDKGSIVSRPDISLPKKDPTSIESPDIESPDLEVTPTETPEMGPQYTPTETPITDNEGNTEAYWRAHAKKLRTDLKQSEKKLESIKNELRILSQGHRRPDEVDALRARQRDLEVEISDLKDQVNNLENEVRKAGGYPGWIRE